MQDTLITYETAKLAKDKGFNWWTEYQYVERNGRVFLSTDKMSEIDEPAPTQSLLQKWLREKHRLSVCVDFREVEGPKIDGINSVYYDVNIYYLMGGDAWKKIKIKECSDDYEKALERGLQEALKLIKI